MTDVESHLAAAVMVVESFVVVERRLDERQKKEQESLELFDSVVITTGCFGAVVEEGLDQIHRIVDVRDEEMSNRVVLVKWILHWKRSVPPRLTTSWTWYYY
jgi:hypothetical protein